MCSSCGREIAESLTLCEQCERWAADLRRGTCSRSAPGGRRRIGARAGLRPAAGRRAARAVEPAGALSSRFAGRRTALVPSNRLRSSNTVVAVPHRRTLSKRCARSNRYEPSNHYRPSNRCLPSRRRRQAPGRPGSSRAARDCGCSRGGGPRHLRATLCPRASAGVAAARVAAPARKPSPCPPRRRPPPLARRGAARTAPTGSGTRGRPPPSSCPRRTLVSNLAEPGSTAARRPLRREKHRGVRVDRIGAHDGGEDRGSHGHLPASTTNRRSPSDGRTRPSTTRSSLRDGTAFARRLIAARTMRIGYTPHNAASVVARFRGQRARRARRSLRQGMRLAINRKVTAGLPKRLDASAGSLSCPRFDPPDISCRDAAQIPSHCGRRDPRHGRPSTSRPAQAPSL